MFVSNKSRWTDHDLMALPREGRKYELLDNQLLMSPVSLTHSVTCVRLVVLLSNHVQRQHLGEVFDSSMGFQLSPDTVLSPDVSFISCDRLNSLAGSPDKFLEGAPELVIEVLSPSDRRRMIDGKIDLYFEHGVRMAWVADPKKQEITIRVPGSEKKLIGLNAVLTGGNVLPKFKCRLSDIFRRV